MEVKKPDIFGKFYEEDLMIDMDAVENILKQDNPIKVSNLVIDRYPNQDKITKSHIDTIMRQLVEEEELEKSDEDVSDIINRLESADSNTERYILDNHELSNIEGSNEFEEKDFSILKDISGNSKGEGNIEDFISLFNDRQEKLKEITSKKVGKIANISDVFSGQDIRVGGLVNFVRTPNKDDSSLDKIINIEDDTGKIGIGFHKEYTDDEELEKLDRVVEDEYICVEATATNEGDFLWGNEIIFPDTPTMRKENTTDRSVEAVFITDTHFGSELFDDGKWKNFVNWIRGKENVEYLFVSGDLVEGVGVYPGQLAELDVPNIYDQYRVCAEAFKQIPDRIKIFASVGNHDMTRLAEPQPRISEDLAKYFGDNVEVVGSPCLVDVEGVKVLMYHGNSLNQMDESIPGVSINEPEKVQKELLIKRHMAPIYGGGTRIAPEKEDYMVMEEVPDIFECGHTHTLGLDTHNRTRIINPGCWVGQTKYQKKKNIDPDVGYAFICDLSDINLQLKQF